MRERRCQGRCVNTLNASLSSSPRTKSPVCESSQLETCGPQISEVRRRDEPAGGGRCAGGVVETGMRPSGGDTSVKKEYVAITRMVQPNERHVSVADQ